MDTEKLWKYLNELFKTQQLQDDWMQILEPEKKMTLKELCEFISANSTKIKIKPRKLFGKNCKSAAIFKVITTELQNRGLNTSKIKPSSQLEELVIDSQGAIIEIVNLLNPKVLPPMDFKENRVYEWSLEVIFWGFLTMMFVFLLSKKLALFVGIIILIAYSLTWVGANMKPEKVKFEGIETMRDLIERIECST